MKAQLNRMKDLVLEEADLFQEREEKKLIAKRYNVMCMKNLASTHMNAGTMIHKTREERKMLKLTWRMKGRAQIHIKFS